MIAALAWLPMARAQAAPRDEPAAPFGLAQLMRALHAVAARRASFTEVKILAALDRPLTVRGTLVYVRPDYLEKTTLTPQRERLIVKDHRLGIETAGQPERVLDLDDQPEIRAMVDTVRGTLSGNLALLQRYYTVALSGTPQAWRLTLTPSGQQIAQIVRVVHIDGAGAAPYLIDTIQANGDTTRMTIVATH